MRSALLTLPLLAAAVLACRTDSDCSLNGECTPSGTCSCDKGWSGSTCGILDLDPSPTIAYGTGSTPQTSSWGGGPPTLIDGDWHLFVSEIAGSCGMCTWSRMSQAIHATADRPQGPYKRLGVAVPVQTHNTYYTYSPTDDLHLLYHIGDSSSPPSCNPFYKCTNGSTPGCTGLRPPNNWPPSTCGISDGGCHIHYSKSLDGPWHPYGLINVSAPGIPSKVSGTSNPAPYIFPNGTVLLIGRGPDSTRYPNHTVVHNHNIFLYRAKSWNSTYHWVPSNGVNGAIAVGNTKLPTEDPTLYKGRRGFHILMHSHPDLTHAWSEDGINWRWNDTLIGPPDPGNGGDNERPRVILSPEGDLEWVFVSQEAGPGDASRTAAFRVRD